jgi:hypothetical protein
MFELHVIVVVLVMFKFLELIMKLSNRLTLTESEEMWTLKVFYVQRIHEFALPTKITQSETSSQQHNLPLSYTSIHRAPAPIHLCRPSWSESGRMATFSSHTESS